MATPTMRQQDVAKRIESYVTAITQSGYRHMSFLMLRQRVLASLNPDNPDDGAVRRSLLLDHHLCG